MFGEINHIPCSLHVRVALQSGLGLIWTQFRIKLHAFGKNFISFCKMYRVKSVVMPVYSAIFTGENDTGARRPIF